jgi:hypothetical protein
MAFHADMLRPFSAAPEHDLWLLAAELCKDADK